MTVHWWNGIARPAHTADIDDVVHIHGTWRCFVATPTLWPEMNWRRPSSEYTGKPFMNSLKTEGEVALDLFFSLVLQSTTPTEAVTTATATMAQISLGKRRSPPSCSVSFRSCSLKPPMGRYKMPFPLRWLWCLLFFVMVMIAMTLWDRYAEGYCARD
jgi:hypothetical protein